MDRKALLKLVKSFGGWLEGDVAYFPSVHQRQLFEKAFSAGKIS